MRMKILETTGVDRFGELSQWGFEFGKVLFSVELQVEAEWKWKHHRKGVDIFWSFCDDYLYGR